MHGHVSGKTYRIAIVEDEADYRRMLAIWLGNDYSVRAFDTAPQLIEALRSGEWFDLIVSDICMPEMSGLDLMGQVRCDAAWSGIPAFALSANSSEIDKQKAFAVGFNEFINKPLVFDELDARIKRYLP